MGSYRQPKSTDLAPATETPTERLRYPSVYCRAQFGLGDQEACNLRWKLSDEGINVRVVVHDRDRKFARGFDSVFEADGARAILTPKHASRRQQQAEADRF